MSFSDSPSDISKKVKEFYNKRVKPLDNKLLKIVDGISKINIKTGQGLGDIVMNLLHLMRNEKVFEQIQDMNGDSLKLKGGVAGTGEPDAIQSQNQENAQEGDEVCILCLDEGTPDNPLYAHENDGPCSLRMHAECWKNSKIDALRVLDRVPPEVLERLRRSNNPIVPLFSSFKCMNCNKLLVMEDNEQFPRVMPRRQLEDNVLNVRDHLIRNIQNNLPDPVDGVANPDGDEVLEQAEDILEERRHVPAITEVRGFFHGLQQFYRMVRSEQNLGLAAYVDFLLNFLTFGIINPLFHELFPLSAVVILCGMTVLATIIAFQLIGFFAHCNEFGWFDSENYTEPNFHEYRIAGIAVFREMRQSFLDELRERIGNALSNLMESDVELPVSAFTLSTIAVGMEYVVSILLALLGLGGIFLVDEAHFQRFRNNQRLQQGGNKIRRKSKGKGRKRASNKKTNKTKKTTKRRRKRRTSGKTRRR